MDRCVKDACSGLEPEQVAWQEHHGVCTRPADDMSLLGQHVPALRIVAADYDEDAAREADLVGLAQAVEHIETPIAREDAAILTMGEDGWNLMDARERRVKIKAVGLQTGGIGNHHEFAQIRHGPLRETRNGIVSGGQDLADVPFAESPVTFQSHILCRALVDRKSTRLN